MLSDAEVLEELTGAGAIIADYFLIGESIYCVNRRGELGGLAADDELSEAMVVYLRRVGVPEYASEEEYRSQIQRRSKATDK
ncbi:unnamed protein product [Gemmata massiliana]|uniref:Uncharacterized protein n=1 Tax=Gemmata massiliana TaxID=1210884 RepID=A0A6P2CWS2_9BACT|nr:hypothetical protein [Gemmata massiliana]VTR93441.1 unnamed protein product [Gemmata massiliana]